MKSKLLKSFINEKGSVLKQKFKSNYETYMNLLSTLMKKSRQAIIDILKQIRIIKYNNQIRTHGKKSKNFFRLSWGWKW